ncbi:hypothetical protein RRG08_023406 [Elysia crispata]|uniref:Uncharacterized protein n=1 Tax=Elysia crispata TaxID=231223 RepID=A0AAE1CXQ8_9GAST|nr:hypothetical protein RRG08_023406 [Elysia crispata]
MISWCRLPIPTWLTPGKLALHQLNRINSRTKLRATPNNPAAERARMCPSPNNLSPMTAGRSRHRHHHQHQRRRSKSPQPDGGGAVEGTERRGHKVEDRPTGHAHHHQRRRSKSPQPDSGGAGGGSDRRGHKVEDRPTGHGHHRQHHHGGGGDREKVDSDGSKRWTTPKPSKEEDDVFKAFQGALQNRELKSSDVTFLVISRKTRADIREPTDKDLYTKLLGSFQLSGSRSRRLETY